MDVGFLGLILPHEHLHGCPQPRLWHLGEAPLPSPGFLLLSLSPPDTSPCCCCFREKDFRLQCLPGWDALGTTEQEEIPSGKVILFPNQKSSEQSKWMFIQGVGLVLLTCTSISCSGTCSFAPSLHQCSDTVCPALPEQKTNFNKHTCADRRPSCRAIREGMGDAGSQQQQCETHFQEG